MHTEFQHEPDARVEGRISTFLILLKGMSIFFLTEEWDIVKKRDIQSFSIVIVKSETTTLIGITDTLAVYYRSFATEILSERTSDQYLMASRAECQTSRGNELRDMW